MAGKLDKLVRSFLQESSNPGAPFDPFNDLQDPTFLSFKIDFFPDGGKSFPEDAYSSGGFLRTKAEAGANTPGNYEFYDSAAEYLSNIGAPAREAYLIVFKDLLRKIQDRAPWYFQSITGLSELYKVNPSNNFRGAEKELVIECLESIDLRMTLLSDLYRNIVFDLKYMREIVPMNLRTFNMKVHVLEMRKFNTTFGQIADYYASNQRPVKGQANQIETLMGKAKSALQKNVPFLNQSGSSLLSPTFSNATDRYADINSKFGGVFSNLGQQAGGDFGQGSLKDAFEAISVITFDLKNCEFDFFSEAPGYLDTVTVKEPIESSHKFKIKVGKIQKVTTYPFYNYVVAEQEKNSRMSVDETLSSPYYEGNNLQGNASKTQMHDYREAIFPTLSDAQAAADAKKDSDALRKTTIERALGGLTRDVFSTAQNATNTGIGQATGGLLGNSKLGNVYGGKSAQDVITTSLNSFLAPGSQLPTTQDSSYSPPKETLKNIGLETLNVSKEIDKNIGYENPPFNPPLGHVNVYE